MHYPSSKLPDVGMTIFSVMSQLAAEHQAINLSQGFPDFDGPAQLLDAVGKYISEGANQYAPMSGVPVLNEQIAKKISNLYGADVSPTRDITVTSGATEALFAAIASSVREGDEVIIFDPAYDSYEPAIQLNGGTTHRIQLQPPQFHIDWQEVKSVINTRTRMIIVNTPHNPTGSVLTREGLDKLAEVVSGTDILVLSDEVYEHITFDGQPHMSVLRHPELIERSFVVSSFGKTYHTTGWKVGYCVAPEPLMTEFRKVHQYLTFSTSTPMQLALADIMRDQPEHYYDLPAFYQRKRDLFCGLIKDSPFRLLPSEGTYFQLVDYSKISEMKDVDFCQWLTKEIGVAAIPVSVFCRQPPDMKLIRFCFAKDDETLRMAAQRLMKIEEAI